MDDSVVAEEIADVVAAAGGCQPDEVKVGTIRPMSNGLFMAWIQCPAAVIKTAQPGKVKLGWTVAKVEMLNARPLQCFKCWGRGHIRAHCTSAVDRSNTCYRCGEEGHPVRSCGNPISCAICRQQGRVHNHRVGSS